MEEIIIPTFQRYKSLRKDFRGMRILRPLQYEALRLSDTTGKMLDVGGGAKADYRDLLDCDSYDSINIDPGIEPTWVVGVEEPFPVDPNSFDILISLNTLEHVFNPQFLCGNDKGVEARRTLCCDHPLYLFHPRASLRFFRPTQSWWEEAMKQHGYTNIDVTPLTWGPRSSAVCGVGVSGPAKRTRAELALLLDLAYAKLRASHPKKLRRLLSVIPAGYFVTADKA